MAALFSLRLESVPVFADKIIYLTDRLVYNAPRHIVASSSCWFYLFIVFHRNDNGQTDQELIAGGRKVSIGKSQFRSLHSGFAVGNQTAPRA